MKILIFAVLICLSHTSVYSVATNGVFSGYTISKGIKQQASYQEKISNH